LYQVITLFQWFIFVDVPINGEVFVS